MSTASRWKTTRGLMDVLQGAQRALKDGTKEKTKLAQEIARLAEGQANAAKAIEQYKSVLRQDPDNSEARERLKTLYKQTQGHNALVELLRQQLERTPQDKYAERLEILREVATVYRQYQKSDTALLSVLNQIVQLDDKLDEHDVLELREIVSLYEKLGRHRELITHQIKLAEVSPDVEEKRELYRAAARRWLEQFSNVQNATEAYAKLLAVAPDDREARERLEELYRKRRAWNELYALYSTEIERAEGATKLTLLREMAQLAAERLNRSEDAVRLYKQILGGRAGPARRARRAREARRAQQGLPHAGRGARAARDAGHGRGRQARRPAETRRDLRGAAFGPELGGAHLAARAGAVAGSQPRAARVARDLPAGW
ncbi:MAG: hypothetical protein QM756_44905 [Polyangiaceae bacterium]